MAFRLDPARSRFDSALAFTFTWEGGFVHDPADAGGRTMKGVTERTWRAWLATRNRARPPGKRRDVRFITPNKVRTIYRDLYWIPARCSTLAKPLCVAHFDAAVHSGPGRAAKFIQSALDVTVDGAIGPITLRAMLEADPITLAHDAVNLRRAFLRRLVETRPPNRKFLGGWMNRVNDLAAYIGEWSTFPVDSRG